MNGMNDDNFNEMSNKAFSLAKKGLGAFFVVWVIGVVLGLGITGLVIVLLVKLIQHLS